jgi:hypothetical protein
MFGNIVLAFSLIVAIIGVVRYKKMTMPFKLLAVWLVIDFILDSCGNPLCIAVYKNNTLLSHVETIGEFIFFAGAYYYLLRRKWAKKLVLTCIIALSVFFVINGLTLQPFTKTFPTYVIMPAEILYVIFAVLLFKQMLQYPVQMNIIKQSLFWFNTAILFFSTTMFAIFSLMNYFSKHSTRESMMIVLYFWYSIDLIFIVLIGMAILNENKYAINHNG